MARLDATHDRRRRSWVASAEGHRDFPIQNLPLGVFNPPGGTERRAGVAIGDMIFDLGAALELDLFAGGARDAAEAASPGWLNELFALGAAPRQALRERLSEILDANGNERSRMEELHSRFLHPAASCMLHLPARIGDYTDFYVGIHHATNVGKVFRPDNPLLPNYKHVPIGYHGRSSSVVISGTPVRRPHGQLKASDASDPSFGPSQRLDYELELGVWIGPAIARSINAMRPSIPIVALIPDPIAEDVASNPDKARAQHHWHHYGYWPSSPWQAA